jgi:hypothetical protein
MEADWGRGIPSYLMTSRMSIALPYTLCLLSWELQATETASMKELHCKDQLGVIQRPSCI